MVQELASMAFRFRSPVRAVWFLGIFVDGHYRFAALAFWMLRIRQIDLRRPGWEKENCMDGALFPHAESAVASSI